MEHDEVIRGYLVGSRRAMGQVDAWIVPVVRNRTWGLRHQEEDLLQEVRLKLYRLFEAGAFRGQSRLKTYVQATAKYTCLDAVRRARIRDAEVLAEEQLPDSRDDPLEGLSRRESARLCYRVLRSLPENCRRLFEMLLERELGYEQIASELSITLGTVKSRIARCRDKAVALRARMAGGAPGGAKHDG